jgi:hypothetical protein
MTSKIMAVKKIENSPRRPKITLSAATPGRNRGEEPPTTADQVKTRNAREDDMDGSSEMTMGAAKTMATFSKTAAEVTSFSQGNIAAIMKSSQVWAAGWQDISKALAAANQAHLDQAMSTCKALASVMSLQEAMSLQAHLMQTPFETSFAETGKLIDASLRLAVQSMAPITERITLAVEKFKYPVN